MTREDRYRLAAELASQEPDFFLRRRKPLTGPELAEMVGRNWNHLRYRHIRNGLLFGYPVLQSPPQGDYSIPVASAVGIILKFSPAHCTAFDAGAGVNRS